ncbi:sensor histidine kinase [Oryzobacter telluris]|uniref:sensor histidine kinase n=1 Tax=Oryzobacter telluris TaxID=3149179 RepID=UPI00370D850F
MTDDTAPATPARLPAAGRVLLVATLAVVVATLLVDWRVPAAHRALLALDPGWVTGPAGLSMVVAGVVVLARRPGNRVGAVLGGFGLWWAVDGLAAAWLGYSTLSDPALPGATTAFTLFQRLGAGLLLALPMVLVLFPDGRWPRGRLGWAAGLAVAMSGLLSVLLLTVPSRIAQEASGSGALPEPLTRIDLDPVTLPLPDGLWSVLLRVAYLMIPVSLVPALVVVVGRHRRATGRTRAQLRWLLWAAAVDVLVMLTVSVLPAAATVGLTAAVAVTSAAVALAAVDPERFDVDRLLGNTVVAAVPVVVTVLLDLAVLGVTSWALGERAAQREVLVLAVVVAVCLWLPLRERLTRAVRRRMGAGQDPYDVVAGLARGLEDSRGSEAELLAVARAVSRAVRSPWVGVEVAQGDGRTLLVEHGSRPQETRGLPVSYRGEVVGHLLLPARGVAGRLRRADERLLTDVVRQAAAAARAARLADELQRSREALVTAVEDERRRLRRDLHDGLGPALAAVATRIDMARLVAGRDAAAADAALAAARTEVGEMLTEVRRLVHGLRPPALDDVGLLRALEQQAALVAPDVATTVHATGDLAALPAAVEVAAFRVAAEAMTNVGRHAAADTATIRLAASGDTLTLDVEDDGVGIPAGTLAGVGLVSLRERAAELGGTCEVGSNGRGTRIRARFPLTQRAQRTGDATPTSHPAPEEALP